MQLLNMTGLVSTAAATVPATATAMVSAALRPSCQCPACGDSEGAAAEVHHSLGSVILPVDLPVRIRMLCCSLQAVLRVQQGLRCMAPPQDAVALAVLLYGLLLRCQGGDEGAVRWGGGGADEGAVRWGGGGADEGGLMRGG
jgi:hypothetical protein